MTELDDLLDLAWQRLSHGVRDRHAAARHPALATVSPDGRPEVRTLVLRAAAREPATLELHADALSAKIASVSANPAAELHVWDPQARLQIRAACFVTVLRHPETSDRWDRVPTASRRTYGSLPVPVPNMLWVSDFTCVASWNRFVSFGAVPGSMAHRPFALRHRRLC